MGHGYPWNERTRALVEAQIELYRLLHSPPDSLELRVDNGFKERVLRALSLSHGRGEHGTTDRRAIVRTEMGADWAKLAEDCEAHPQLSALYLWVDAAVAGGLD